jgi:predicted nucleic acid-binding protein
VDKSALARMTASAVYEKLAPIIEAGEAATCDIVDLDVLFSARNHDDYRQIRARRALAYTNVPLTEAVFQRALDVQQSLAANGRHRLPIPDLIIAAAAESASLVVLHYDADFERIASITKQPTEWVAPRGTL